MSENATETINLTDDGLAEGFAIGYSINDKYVIETELGKGGMGLTYRAHDVENINRRVVIKTILKKSAKPESNLAFLKEGEALGRINHDGVVKFYDKGEDRKTGLPFLVMEYVDGVPLLEIIRRGQMDLEKAVNLTEKIALALTAAHREKILHRDLKPANVMIVESELEEDKIKLIDFGVAKVADSVVGGSTLIGGFKGTLQYASPEQLGGFQTEAGETFNLAALVYEMLTQKRPFPIKIQPETNESGNAFFGRKFYELKKQHKAGAKNPLEFNPQIPEASAGVILKGLAENAAERWQTPLEFARELKKSSLQTVTEKYAVPTTKKSLAKYLILSVATIFLLLIIGWLVAKYLPTSNQAANTTAQANQTSAKNTAETVFNISFDVQKMKNNLPEGATFATADKSKIAFGDKFNLKIEREMGGYFYLVEQNGENLRLLFPDGTQEAKSISRWNVAQSGQSFWLIWSKDKVDVLENPTINQAEAIRFLQTNQKNLEIETKSNIIAVKSSADLVVYQLNW